MSRTDHHTQATITAQYPCHPDHKVRLDVLSSRYDRTCPECGLVYVLDRRTLRATPGMRVDAVEWVRSDA